MFSSKLPRRALAFFEAAENLVWGAPAGCLHEAFDGSLETGGARDFGFLLVGVVALDRPEVVAEELVVVEVALYEFALVLAGFLFGLRQVGAAHGELGEQQVRRLGAVEFAMERPAALDAGHSHFPGAVGEHDDVRPELCSRQNGLIACGDGVDAPVEGVLRPGRISIRGCL